MDPEVRALALKATAGLKQKDYHGERERLHALVRDRVRYVRDVRGVETLHEARQVWRQRAGDCDDKSLLLAALLESIGHTTRFRAVGARPGTFQHVLVEGWDEKSRAWVSMETTAPVPVGWAPRNVREEMYG